MRYPTDMIDSSMDYFKIEILKNIKQGGGFGNISSLAGGTGGARAAHISDQYANEGARKTIILPIPSNIQDNNAAQWGENKLNDFAAAALGIVGSVVESDNLKDIPGNVTKKMNELQSGGGGSDDASDGSGGEATNNVPNIGFNDDNIHTLYAASQYGANA